MQVHNRTPLHLSSINGHLEVTRLLLDRGGDPKAKNDDGTPLHFSSDEGHLEVTRLLLERGADPTIKSNVSVAACVLRSRVCATRLGVRAGVGWPLLRPSDRSSLRLSASCVRSSPRRACARREARRPWTTHSGTARRRWRSCSGRGSAARAGGEIERDRRRDRAGDRRGRRGVRRHGHLGTQGAGGDASADDGRRGEVTGDGGRSREGDGGDQRAVTSVPHDGEMRSVG